RPMPPSLSTRPRRAALLLRLWHLKMATSVVRRTPARGP
ncbi:uncharacterized protein METZ01_LOCUS359223, partial [marine metagenome]